MGAQSLFQRGLLALSMLTILRFRLPRSEGNNVREVTLTVDSDFF